MATTRLILTATPGRPYAGFVAKAAGATVNPPIKVEASQMHVAGAKSAQVYAAGAKASEVGQ